MCIGKTFDLKASTALWNNSISLFALFCWLDCEFLRVYVPATVHFKERAQILPSLRQLLVLTKPAEEHLLFRKFSSHLFTCLFCLPSSFLDSFVFHSLRLKHGSGSLPGGRLVQGLHETVSVAGASRKLVCCSGLTVDLVWVHGKVWSFCCSAQRKVHHLWFLTCINNINVCYRTPCVLENSGQTGPADSLCDMRSQQDSFCFQYLLLCRH